MCEWCVNVLVRLFISLFFCHIFFYFFSLYLFSFLPFLSLPLGSLAPNSTLLLFIMDSIAKGIRGRGRDTHATAVSGGGKADHPSSSTSNCQELGVGNLAPALDTASGRVPQVGDLACGVFKAPGSGCVSSEESHLEEWQRAARAVESIRLSGLTSPNQVRKHKRARPVIYSSEEEESRIDWPLLSWEGSAETPLSQVETGRLLDNIREVTLDAENARLKCRNLKGDISGIMKRSFKKTLESVKTLSGRLQIGADDPPSAKETIAQLKAELRAKVLCIRELKNEVACFKKEKKKASINPLAERSQTRTPEMQQLASASRTGRWMRLSSCRTISMLYLAIVTRPQGSKILAHNIKSPLVGRLTPWMRTTWLRPSFQGSGRVELCAGGIRPVWTVQTNW
ncbi:uncharacterized protein LOC124431447 [Vespa crabro]|uniref:uncharacterized protein LOC124431447 n=1 Tax=Vespa crabro TaxID=7445 RepID=UPI001EFFCF6C|nr:uncharacterized protein LOC124431447 [Vespa crabro]